MSGLEAPSPQSPPPAPPSSSSSAMTVDFSAFGLPFGDGPQGLYLFPEAPFSPKDGAKGSSPQRHSRATYDHAGDAMLSAINYGEDEVLQEGFEVPFGSLDGLLRLPPRPATAPADPSPFDLLGDAELQLSPQSFGTAADAVGSLGGHASDTGVGGHDPGTSGPLSCGTGLLIKQEVDRMSPVVAQPMADLPVRTLLKVGGNGRAPSAQPCPVCGKVFSSSSALTKHKLTHSDERKYVCQQCNKAFKRQDHLNGHLLTHRNKKPYQCDVDGCDKSYCDARSLRRHKENHHASVALTVLPFQAIPLPPQLQLVTFPSDERGPPLWATQQGSLLVAPQEGLVPTRNPTPPRPSPQPQQQQPQPQHQPQDGAAAPPLLQQLLEPGKPWQGLPTARRFPCLQVAYPMEPLGSVRSLSPGDIKMEVSLEAALSECSLCHCKFEGLAELNSHVRLHHSHGLADSGSVFQEDVKSEPVTCQPPLAEPPRCATANPRVPTLSEEEEEEEEMMANQARAPLPPLSAWSAGRTLRPSVGSERRRHSDSDHLAFERGGGLLADLLLGPRRTARVGSDPGLEPLPSFAHLQHKALPMVSLSLGLGPKLGAKAYSLPGKDLQGLVTSGRNSLVSSPPDAMSYENPHEEDPFSGLDEAFEEKSDQQQCTFVDSPSPPNELHIVEENEEIIMVPDSPPIDSPSLPPPPSDQQMNDTVPTSVHTAPDPSEEVAMDASVCKAPDFDDDDVFLSPIPTSPLRSRRKHRPEVRRLSYFPSLPLTVSYTHSQTDVPSAVPDVANAGADVANAGADVPSAVPDVANAGADVANAGADVPSAVPDVANAGADVANVGADVPSVGPDVANVGADVANAGSDVANAGADIPSVGPDVANAGPDVASGGLDVASGVPDVANAGADVANSKVYVATRCHRPKPDYSSRSNNSIVMRSGDTDTVTLSEMPVDMLSRRRLGDPPLYIPPHVNAIGFPSRLRSPRLWDPCAETGHKGTTGGAASPPPYTPPPMLSPLRSGSGLFWHVYSGPRSAGPTTPHTGTPRGGCSVLGEAPLSDEEEELAPETDILPHVNVGPQYQARLPPLDLKSALEAEHKADMVWDPRTCDHLCEDELDAYLELASCAVVPGGGRNREYAFHLLALCQGNLQEATLRLMDRQPMLPGGHPLLTYRYSECHRWSREEVERFQEGLATYDKDFLHVASKVGSKSVQQCVELYYVWKKVAPEEYRRLCSSRRRKELEVVAPDSVMLDEEDGDEGGSQDASQGSPPTAQPPPEPPQQCEPPQVFPCRLCGRVFAKVKSRNAHMKSHGSSRAVGSSRFEF
ncbi:unnamed protein product [Ixodes hexagonus]